MPVTFKRGNLFDSGADVLVNAVNCVGVMGKGIALEFKKRYPGMFREYARFCKSDGLEPGILHIWNGPGMEIINFPTKNHWRKPSEYSYIEKGLKSLRSYLKKKGRVTIAIPALGCSSGGLNWKIVSPMITEFLDDLPCEILAYYPEEK